MIDYTHYIKAKSIADTYCDNINMLAGTAHKQHFLTRLSLCQGYHHLLDNTRKKDGLFKYTSKDLTRKLNMDFNEMWEESMVDDDFGYKKDISKVENDDIKFYFGMTEIMDETCVLLRNCIELPKGIEKKINKENLQRMIDIANNDQVMRDKQGTIYVNGIGEIICLKRLDDNLIPIEWQNIYDCYADIFTYYINKCSDYQKWLLSKSKRHNYIYGLTHCIINLTNYYTDSIVPELKEFCNLSRDLLIKLIDSQRNTNYSLFSDDALAEMLLCIKLAGLESSISRTRALDALSLRFDSAKLMFREHKAEKLKDELLKNEHTNILYVLNVLL